MPARGAAGPAGRGFALARALLRCAGVALAAAVASACAVQQYHADPYADPYPATLVVMEYAQAGAVWNAVVKDVDGKPPPYLFRETQNVRSSLFGGGSGPGKSISLAPGDHDLRVGIYWNSFPKTSRGNPFYGDCHVAFTARPGTTYQLASDYSRDPSDDDFSMTGGTWSAWIVDTSSGAIANPEPCRPSPF